MNLRKYLHLICMLASMSSLILGFGWVGSWGGAVIVGLASFLAWAAARRKRFGWTDSAALITVVVLAAAGLPFGAQPAWMILGASFALAAWDLALFDQALTSSANLPSNATIERKHYTSLGLALVFGLLVGLVGRMVQLQISLGVMFVLVLLALIGLDRLWRLYRK